MSIDTVARSAAAELRSVAGQCDEIAALARASQRIDQARSRRRHASWVAVAAVLALVAIVGWHLLPVNAQSTPVSPSPSPTHGRGLTLPMTFQAPVGWHATTDGRYVRLVPADGSARAITIVPAERVFDPPSYHAVKLPEDPTLWITLHPGLEARKVDTPYGPRWESGIFQLSSPQSQRSEPATVPLVPLPSGPDNRLALSPDDQSFWWGLVSVPGGTVIVAAESASADDDGIRDALYEVLRSIKIPKSR